MTRLALCATLLAAFGWIDIDQSVGQDVDETRAEIDTRARDVLDKYIQALGGEELMNSVSSLKLTVRHVMRAHDGDQEGTFETTDTLLVSGERWVQENSRASRRGFDGSRYWSKTKHGPLEWDDDRRYPLNQLDPITYPLHLVSFPGSVKFGGTTEIDGQPAIRLYVDPRSPEPRDRIRMTPKSLVFDAESGLLIQIVHEHKTLLFSDYRDVDGIMLPFQRTSTTRFADISSENKCTLESVEFNIPIDDNLMEVPGEGADREWSP